MKRLLILLSAASVSTPALAQHGGHGAPSPPAPPTRQAEDAAPARPAARTRRRAPAARPAPAPADPHAGHNMPARPAPAQPSAPVADPHAGHNMPAPAPAPSPTPAMPGRAMPPQRPQSPAGQAAQQPMGAMQPAPDPHAGHQVGAASQMSAPPVAPPPPEALAGPAHAADRVFGEDRMAEARQAERQEHGGTTNYRFLVDQLEVSFRDGAQGYVWDDAQFWYGGDIDKLWIKSQGEGTFGEGVERVEAQALWSHAINPWFDLQAGVRYDFLPDPRRAYLVLGIQGLAPYWFEVDGALFLSNKGDLSARFEAEYDLRITQMLILQPRFEVDFSLQDVPELGIGSGLSTVEPGLRLRYEIVPEFAPYVGVQYERAFGDTARFRRIAGDSVGGWSLVLGVRAWF